MAVPIMEALETLAVALGFASLAGINLYLTVLVTGVAVNLGWVNLIDKYADLAVLGEPVVLIAAGSMAAIEFFSDKIPWVDSAWDSVHTFIRPVGGGMLALSALGPADPAVGVVIAMLAGGTSLMTHGMKSGTRIAVNQSPEPISNMAVSFTEDAAVLGGLALMSVNPLLFAGICVVGIGVAIFLGPRLYRRMRTFTWLLGRKLVGYVKRQKPIGQMEAPLSVEEQVRLAGHDIDHTDVAWSYPVVVGAQRKFAGVKANTFAKIYSLADDRGRVHLIGEIGRRTYHQPIDLSDLEIVHESQLASENLVLTDRSDSHRKLVLRMTTTSKNIVKRVVQELKTCPDRSEQPLQLAGQR